MTTTMVPLRHAAVLRVSNVDKKAVDGEVAVRLVNYTDVYYQGEIHPSLELMSATATMDQVERFRVLPGDSIITKDSESPDDIAIPAYVRSADADMVCGYHLAMLRPRASVFPKFLYWALSSNLLREQFSLRANGMTRYGLTYEAIQGARLPLPPLEDQRRIAAFLDDQVATIDAAVDLSVREVACLDEALLSLNFEAAVDAGASLRHRADSLAWCGSIPASWGIVRLRLVARMGTGHTPGRDVPEYWLDGDLTVPWVSTADIVEGQYSMVPLLETVRHISEIGLQNSAAVLHPPGTVMLCRTASVGLATLTGIPMSTSQRFVTWTPGTDLDAEYLLAVVRAMRPEWLRLANGSTHGTVFFPDLEGVRIPLPPIQRQREIVSALTRDVERVVESSEAIAKRIKLLTDMRTSLITAAVTGDFDVTTARTGMRV